jgi:hypothetical protein
MSEGLIVHCCDYSSQPSIHIKCCDVWSTPEWGPRSGMTDIEGVYKADSGHYYTFDNNKVTCKDCLK